VRVPSLVDGRVARDLAAVALLAGASGTVRELRASLDALREVVPEPEDVIADAAAHDVEVVLSTDGRGLLDATFHSRGAQPACAGRTRTDPRPWSEFVHRPSATAFASAQVGAWREDLVRQLPDYMVPSIFVRLERLPLTPNGKIDRKALPEPDVQNVVAATTYVAAVTPTEIALVEIWSEVLRLERVGATDDFFALGGHSLTALRALARISDRLGVRLPLRALFEAPTVRELAARIDAEHGTGNVGNLAVIERIAGDAGPLSHRQELLWLLQRTSPGLAAYNMPDEWRLEGALNVDALQRALDALVARHEALRTRFVTREGVAVQEILPAAPVQLEHVDLRSLPPTERAAAAERTVSARARDAFDLAAGMLLRAVLVRLAEDEHRLLVVSHHIVSDGWSRAILLRDLGALYRAFARGESVDLAPLATRYVDFAAWQRAALSGPALERDVAYWTEALAGASLTLDLPTDRPRPSVPSFEGAKCSAILPTALLEGLRSIARANDATLYMALLAVLDSLLSRYTQQDDIAFATAVAGRAHAGLEGVVGYFANTIAHRVSLAGDPTYLELLARVRDAQLGASEHSEVPFEMLVMEANGASHASDVPALSQVMFVLQNNESAALTLGDVTVRPASVETGGAKFDLSVAMSETARGLRIGIQYRSELFDATTVERMLRHLEVLVEGIVNDPHSRVSRLPLLDAHERAQIEGWNAVSAPYPRDATVPDLFRQVARRAGNAIALEQGDTTVTYAELDRASDALASQLRAMGVVPGTLIGVCIPRSPAAVCSRRVRRTCRWILTTRSSACASCSPTRRRRSCSRIAHCRTSSAQPSRRASTGKWRHASSISTTA
jgi:acyl carrier protein